jgi:adenylate cyclase
VKAGLHVKLEKGHDYLFSLLSERNANPSRADQIDRSLWEELGDHGAILATDSSGFTRITRKRGTLHFLSMIQKGFAMALPIIEREGGTLVKQETDNILCTFPEPLDAMKAADGIRRELEAHNLLIEDADSHIRYSFGIGYGNFLRFSHDIFGDEVNVSSKLGEDTATENTILVSKAAFDRLGNSPAQWSLSSPKTVSLGGTALEYREATHQPK